MIVQCIISFIQQSLVGFFDGLNPRHGGLSVESFKETLVYPLTQATEHAFRHKIYYHSLSRIYHLSMHSIKATSVSKEAN